MIWVLAYDVLLAFQVPPWIETKDEGFWTGWIGVYGVGYSDNVILYREHLQDGDGIEDDEMVSEQAGTHPANANSSTAAAMGADVDGDGTKEHSNIHLGELHWGTNPDDDDSTPSPSLTVEVDAYEDADRAALSILDDAEENYALYGLDVEFVKDQTSLTDKDLRDFTMTCDITGCEKLYIHYSPPTNFEDANWIESEYHNNSSRAYMFISSDGGKNPLPRMPDWAPEADGVASSDGSKWVWGHVEGFGFGTLVFTKDHNDGPTPIYYQKTVMHEIGHLLGAGRNDDGDSIIPDEVYSGGKRDETPEAVDLRGDPEIEWSVMSGGWNDPVGFQPMDREYVAFSIEELFTIEFKNIDSKDD